MVISLPQWHAFMKPPRHIKLKPFTYSFDALQFNKFTFSGCSGKKKKIEKSIYEKISKLIGNFVCRYEHIPRYVMWFGSFCISLWFVPFVNTHTLHYSSTFSHSIKPSDSGAKLPSLLQINIRAAKFCITSFQFSGVFNKTVDVNGRRSSWVNLNTY